MDNICPWSISILVDDFPLHVHKGRTDSEDFVHFVWQVDGYSLGDYFDHFEPPDNSFHMYAHISNPPCSSYILIRQLPSFMSERSKFNPSLKQQIFDGKAFVCQHFITGTKLLQEARLLSQVIFIYFCITPVFLYNSRVMSDELVTTPASINWRN